jgi:hypothetical protein
MWSWVRQCRNRCAETNERALVRECESFLSGRYATFLESRGLPVPDWAWLSELAHAPAEQVTALVAAPRRRARVLPPARWQKAMSLLAQELVATAQRTDCTVDELRRSVLLPLELELVDPSVSAWTLEPGPLFDDIRRTLVQYRKTSHQ